MHISSELLKLYASAKKARRRERVTMRNGKETRKFWELFTVLGYPVDIMRI